MDNLELYLDILKAVMQSNKDFVSSLDKVVDIFYERAMKIKDKEND